MSKLNLWLILLAVLCFEFPASAQSTRFFGSCTVRGPYGTGCINFYDGKWTDEQMHQICHAVSARHASTEINPDRKCAREQFGKLCVSQQLFSLAYIYIEHMDDLSCHGIMNGKLYSRPDSGW
jgi:hypothetical protein